MAIEGADPRLVTEDDLRQVLVVATRVQFGRANVPTGDNWATFLGCPATAAYAPREPTDSVETSVASGATQLPICDDAVITCAATFARATTTQGPGIDVIRAHGIPALGHTAMFGRQPVGMP